jgi:DNA-binding LytR/AlgR family response regulator
MLEIAICEDDIMQQEKLEMLLFEIGLKESINLRKFDSGERLIKSYELGDRYGIILLDIQLDQLDGIQTAEIIRGYDKSCLIIIITSVMEYAVEGYSIDAYDFIMKPVDKVKFARVINKAVKELQVRMNKTYLIQTRDKTKALKLSEIQFIESNRNRVIIHTNKETYTNNESISSVVDKLGKDGFVRISRYYIANIYYVKEIGAKTLILNTGEELKYSEIYRDNIKKEYLKFMMGDM